MQEIAAGVGVLPVTIVNTYFTGAPGQPWFLVDTGTPRGMGKIQGVAEARYGQGARPQAILLTHGHPDHSGNAAALSDFWNVPIYAHRLELPFIQGKSKYPPNDHVGIGEIDDVLCARERLPDGQLRVCRPRVSRLSNGRRRANHPARTACPPRRPRRLRP